MKNWIWLVIDVILLLTISFNSEAVSVRNKRNTAPDGVVLDSVNVLPGTGVLLSQEGKTVSITCKQSNTAATGLHFQLQVNSGAGGTWTALHLTSTKPVWKIVPEAGKQYKCVATNSAGTKESKIYKPDVISIKIRENPCKVAQFQPSLACTCKAISKIGNANMNVKWYADGFTEGMNEFSPIPPGVNIPVKDGVVNRNRLDYRDVMYATLIQCQLWKCNGIELPLQNQILHQTKMDVTYFPDEIQTLDTFTGEPDIRTEGEVVEYICRTVIGRPDPTVIYQQKRRGSERWEPIPPDPQPQRVPLKGSLKVFDTTYKFKANFKLHNGTSFRCAVKENLTFPEPRQFNPIIVHYFAAPVYKKSSGNETHAVYIVTVNSNPLSQQVTCDPPAVVQKLSNYQWNITIPIVNSTTTDYRGRCLADGINERVIDVAGYHHAGPTDEPVPDGWNGGIVFGAVIGVLILLILIILFTLCLCGCLRCRKPDDELCRCGNLSKSTTISGNDNPGESLEMKSLLKEEWDVDQVRKNLKETYQRMIDVENYKEVSWSYEFVNFNDIFTQEHAEIRAQKRKPKKNEESEEQSLTLPDDFEKLFTYKERAMKPVCLVGEPGIGKTTQVVNQVLSWERSPFLKRFPMLFYIPLNELPADNACIYTYIYEDLLNPKIRKVLPIDSFKEFVEENAEKSIFFLDGFDELKNDKAKKDIVHVTNKLPKAHIVITTRESGGSMIVTDPKFTVVSISGFKQEEVIDIMKRKFPMCDPCRLFNVLRDAAPPLFKSIYYNPLILHMFCFLYMDDEEITIPSKLTDIYIDLTCFLISIREGLELSKECFFRNIGNSEALKDICQVAYETLIAHQNSFSENHLKLDESKMTALTCKEVSPRRKTDRSVQLRFIHKSVHEFLAAVHSVMQFNNSGEIPWNKCAFEQLPDELVKYGELYPRFMAGLLYRYKYNRGLGELFKTLIDEHLKAITIVDKYNSLDFITSEEVMLIPDYERHIELRSERTVLSEQWSIYLDEADWPDDAISEIVPYMQKMLFVSVYSRSWINMLAKILEHKLCQIELVYIQGIIELKPDEYRRVLETAITSNTSLQGMIIESHWSSIRYQFLTMCKKSNSINWFVQRGGGCYKKLDNDWLKTSHVIESDDDARFISGTNTHNTVEILIIDTEVSAKLLDNIQKSFPFLKHLYLRVPPGKGENINRELTNLIPGLKSLELYGTFNENLTSEELKEFYSALKSSDIETIRLKQCGLRELTTDQRAAISDSVASMPKLKRLFFDGRHLQSNRVLDHLPRLTVLTVDLWSEADGDALVRYLLSDAVNQLIQVSIDSYLDRPEQNNRIFKQLKHVSSIRYLKFFSSLALINTQHDIDLFVKSIVELIENLPHLSDLYVDCYSTDPDTTRDYIISELKKLNKRLRVEINLSEPSRDSSDSSDISVPIHY
ncbi:uncharacterized protein LOC141906709 [Tubulanus polymorphus]|uniref:uncharacterized protein LOC141906709 n=1 Tax=Tubulanus polymorphus TaxID=672921 RepID=UPI003DA547EF